MTLAYPLSRHAAAEVIACGPGGAITAAQFHEDVQRLASSLPSGRHVVNTCHDRYLFMVGFGACLVTGRITLMPSSFTPATLRQIRERYPDVMCLHDGGQRAEGLPEWRMDLIDPRQPAHDVPAPAIPGDQVAAIVFTSGSTGEPTAHAKHWDRLCANAASEAERLNASGLAIAATVPAQHMYGFESSVLLALHGGASVWRNRPFYPADVASAIQAMPRRRMLVTTPFHLAAVVDAGMQMPPCDLLLCATAPLSTALAHRAEAVFDCPLVEIYGCTESGQVASRRTTASAAWQLLPGLGMAVQDGSAWVFGGHVEGRVPLSDHIDALNGDCFTLGERHADMVNVAGKRTSLAALNAHLRSIEGVADGCFLLPPEDEAAGAGSVHRLAALVVAPDLDTAGILKALRQRIDPAFLPRPLLKVDALPRNATGKVVATEVAALYRALRPLGPRP